MEESTRPEEIALSDLSKILSDGHEQLVIETVLEFVDRLFAVLGLIDTKERKNGKWHFRSHPAWLMARSVLETLSTDGQTIFDPDYWGPGGAKSGSSTPQVDLKMSPSGAAIR